MDSSGVSFAGGAKIASLLAYAVLLIGGASGAARAQDTSVGATASRESLAQRVATDESEIARGNLKASRKKELELEIATIKDRLDNGDFHTGDLIVVTVTIPNLNPPKTTVDTSTVRANNFISITELPDLSVKGVLKSEIQDKVTALAEKYIKEPKVRVNFTTRVMILGGVVKAGTYNISPDRQLTELVTTAGGGTPTAKLDQLEVKRGAKVILSLNDSKKALVTGKTLEQVGIQPGDEVTIPQRRTFNWQVIVQFALLVSSLTFAAIQFLQFYYSE
ncbi:MAG: polysaccharide biosynthesis/export family protein [Gemmatimonadaceae bacterium]